MMHIHPLADAHVHFILLRESIFGLYVYNNLSFCESLDLQTTLISLVNRDYVNTD